MGRMGVPQVVAVGLSLGLIAWNIQLLQNAGQQAEAPVAGDDGSRPRPPGRAMGVVGPGRFGGKRKESSPTSPFFTVLAVRDIPQPIVVGLRGIGGAMRTMHPAGTSTRDA